ncbi:ENTH domain-containing protein C19F8.03c like [Verticillium longisporum]|nr:ENTH domain-containing protein C19F8.03c like [Verticillium longisporum]
MSSSFEKSVKGATKIKAAPPKTKYIEHILVATHSGEAGVAEVFRSLQFRLRDSTWTVVFKSLITIHLMIREGSPDATLAYLSEHRNLLSITTITDAQTQGRNIRAYANYLQERAKAYRDTKCDWVRVKETRLEKMTVDKGLLRETESLQRQVSALLKCDIVEDQSSFEVTTTAFRLLVLDLLALFQSLNQAMINILGCFFELSKPDAERALEIYRQFAKQTDFVVSYLRLARQYEHLTRVEVPKLKHAPVNLKQQLEEYLNDPDFEVNRRQYIAEVQAKKNGGTSAVSKASAPSAPSKPKHSYSNSFPEPTPAAPQAAKPQAKGPAPDLIDFFESIEQNQTPMAQEPAPQQQAQQQLPQQQLPMQTGFVNNPYQQQALGFQQTGLGTQQTGLLTNPYQTQQAVAPQSYNPWGQQQQQPQQIQSNFTGAGFGGYTPQPGFQPGALGSIPQEGVASFQTGTASPAQNIQPPQTTNPFRASMLMTQQTGFSASPVASGSSSPPVNGGLQRQSTNPFARSSPQAQQPFAPAGPIQQQVAAPPAPLQPMATGTNPFAKNFGGSAQPQRPVTSAGPLAPQQTGTNPFRQGAFVNHQTGLGWQHNQQTMGGGLDQLGSIPVFPRPAQQSPWHQ